MRKNIRKVLAVIITLCSVICFSSVNIKTAKAATSTVSHVSIHDPSVVKGDDGYYYIFGSHMAFAKSSDLINWQTITNNINTDYRSIFKVGADWAGKGVSGYDVSGNIWAPDVIYNKSLGKWCMYMSINGPDWNSSIEMLVGDSVNGPWTYAGTVIYSGFNNSNHPVTDTDYAKVCGNNDISRYLTNGKWNSKYGTNAIDPCVFYDQAGKLWMVYGSWFGGIFALKLDDRNGLRDYSWNYGLDTDASDGKASDPYLGARIAGGMGASGEAPYMQKIGQYYYLFVTYGGLTSNGGYNTRVFRSKHLTGPYLDAAGNYATYTSAVGVNNTWGNVGVRLKSYYKWDCMSQGQIAQGHNSVLVDDDGKIYDVYHTRFDDGYEFHEVRVHQMFVNSDGWLCEAPFEYTGETISSTGYSNSEIVGSYEFIRQDPNLVANASGYKVISSSTVNLNSDGTVSGAISGTWSAKSNSPELTIYSDGVKYSGVFLKQAEESDSRTIRMTFTVTGNNNVCLWGAKGAASGSDNVVSADIAEGTYFIKNAASGLYMDVVNSDSANGANIDQYEFNGCDAEKFKIKRVGNGYYVILTGASDYTSSLDVYNITANDGTNIDQWEYWGGDGQLFKIKQNSDGTVSFLPKSGTGKAVEVYNAGTSNGNNVDLWNDWGGSCQKWTLEKAVSDHTSYADMKLNGTYYIKSVYSGLYLDVDNGSSADGTNVRQWSKNGSNAQKFKLVGVGKGYYAMLTGASGYKSAVDITGGSALNGANVEQWTFWNGDMQLIKVKKNSDGTCSFLTKASNCKSAFDVYNFSKESGGNIDQWENWNTAIQKFMLEKAQ